MAYTFPKLSFALDALEPHLDAKTMEIHHDKHHQTYLDNLNKAVSGRKEVEGKTVEQLLSDLASVPEDIRNVVRNHGGGFANHNLYWEIMGPNKGGEPQGSLADALKKDFGSFTAFKEKLETAAKTHFGSGWAWLSVNKNGGLEVFSTPNQDTPLSSGKTPILVIDVWEHAYYLKYQNRRADFVAAFWNVINWDVVSEKFKAAKR